MNNADAYGIYGGIASVGAAIITHPLDMIRIQMQAEIRPLTMYTASQLIIKHGGKLGFYYGFNASIIRHICHAMMRFSLYEEARHRGLVPNFYSKICVGAGSGFVAGLVNTPLERVGVHMRTDVIRPPKLQRNYKDTKDGLNQLYMVGGFRNLYAFAISSALRSTFITVGQISIYEEVKEEFGYKDTAFVESFQNFFVASVVAGSMASIIALPLEVIKTIDMNAEYGKYKGSWDVANSIMKDHGVRGFCRGFIPSFLRLLPQTVLIQFFYEELRAHHL